MSKEQVYLITIHPEHSLDAAWDYILQKNDEPLYSEEDESGKKIYARCAPETLNHPSISSFTPYELPEIDWDAQWEGKEALSLAKYGFPEQSIQMAPGAGFGDLSHPTTSLVCHIMSRLVSGKKILDVGSGSGILSFAAKEMGAAECIGIEIDLQAIAHAQVNAALNGYQIPFLLPEQLPSFAPEVILMNMITSEQKAAWMSLSQQNRGLLSISDNPILIITSGVLIGEKSQYLEWASSLGWELLEALEEDCWIGFLFSSSARQKVKP